ncbi:MAG: transcriptional repressor [Chloroflexi bacterium]|nr:transcriptional repressor [Chloroflexota bacterium]
MNTTSNTSHLESPAGRLRRAGLRVTPLRLAMLEALAGPNRHLDADAAAAAARTRLGSVSTQAVYNALAALTEAGLLRRVQLRGGPACYEVRAGNSHPHAVCRVCGATADVDYAADQTPYLEPADARGYLIEEAQVVFWGVCPACRQVAAPKAGSER